ncbi:lecithin retinol acyltransferase family protein [Pseudanabaena sp. 'Roaring Creek']|uniref:lecithin retinol acyltransferase family protein n=1 Tax=Pseudanabaena sp. 'Roaring Creek' TaxID=1681830 RepID=UPI0006D81D05|nr:lecithin retinol acyltransferase family protein [Pseudanabaena sp. 'Roaring Creek']
MNAYEYSKLAARNDAARKLKCKPSFKQVGAACKPLKNNIASEPNNSLGHKAILPMNVSAGLILTAGIGVASATIANDVNNVVADVSHLEKTPIGDKFDKVAIAKEYDEKFKPGDLIRSAFPLPVGKNKYAYHYAIYAGNGDVIESAPDKSGGAGIVRNFAHDSDTPGLATTKYELVDLPPDDGTSPIHSRAHTLELAKSMVGLPFKFDLIESNCEAFARTIAYGGTKGAQSEKVSKFGLKTVTSVFDVVDRVALGGVLGKGIHSDEIRKTLEDHNYDPELIKTIFKSKIDERQKEIAKKRTDSDTNPLADLNDPKEFTQLVQQASSSFQGAAKLIFEKEMYKVYLIALFMSVSKPSAESSSKKDSTVEDLIAEILRRSSVRLDTRVLHCKSGYKQIGNACKPIRNTATTQQSNGSNIALPSIASTAIILGGLATAGAVVGNDVSKLSDPEEIKNARVVPANVAPSKEILADYEKNFKKGDLIKRGFKGPTGQYNYHYAIYAGNGEIFELAMDKYRGSSVQRNKIGRTTETEGLEYQLVKDLPKGALPKYSRDKSLKIAESLVGVPFKFDGVSTNCEYFARLVVEGSARSSQMESLGGFTKVLIKGLIKTQKNLSDGHPVEEVAKILMDNNYNPDLIKAVFKTSVEKRQHQINNTKGIWRGDSQSENDMFANSGIKSPQDFVDLVQKTSSNFDGVAKQALEQQMYKAYLIALFALTSPKISKIKQDSFEIASDHQKMVSAVLSIISRTYGGISTIVSLNRNPNGLITVYFRPLSNPRSLIKMKIGNSISYKDITDQSENRNFNSDVRVDSSYISEYLATQLRLDSIIGKQQKKCVKGTPCKGECIPRSSTCEVELEKVIDIPTIQKLDPPTPNLEPSRITATVEHDIYDMMNIRDLKEEARKKGVMRYSYMTQDQLKSAIKVHDSDPNYQESIRKSLQHHKDLATLKKTKNTEIGRAISTINPALGRQFNLLTAISKKFQNNPTEALIYALPAIAGTTKVVMGILQKQRTSNIKEAAGAAVNDAEDYRKDIDENSNPDSVNFYVGGYGRGSKDLYNKVANSPLAKDEDTDWLKKGENIPINREGEDVPIAHNPSQALGNNITTGYNVVINNTMKRGKSKEAVELAAKLYAQGTKWRTDENGIKSMPSIQVLAAEDGGVVARDAIEILQQMPKDPTTKFRGKDIADRVKLVTLGTPYFGETKANIPEVNLVGDGDPWGSLPFNKGSQTHRVTGIGGASQSAYTSSSNGIDAIFKNLRSGSENRGVVDADSVKEAASAQKKSETQQEKEASQANAAADRAESDKARAEKQAHVDKLIRDELKAHAGNSIEELERLIKDPDAFAKAKKKVSDRLRNEKQAADFAKRSGVA